jgi:hypothetical protein
MKISELIEILEKVKGKHGDIEVTKNSKNNGFDGIHVTTFFVAAQGAFEDSTLSI